jgi:pimeloyl-ACP methyl ester carboxylesterase
MKITDRSTSMVSPAYHPTAPAAGPHDEVPAVEDRADLVGSRGDAHGAAQPPQEPSTAGYPSAAAKAVSALIDLPKEPAPHLPRPVLMVHGFLGDASDFASMVAWLERDGANKFGGVIHGGQPFEADPQGNFFALEFSKRWNPIERNVEQLKAAVEAICRATGASGVDIVAHSKGGLDVRTYLMDPEEKVDHLLLLGSPSHGVSLANAELFAREHLSIPTVPLTRDPDAQTCLHELSQERDHSGKVTNPLLEHLNEGWEIQRGRADIMSIAGVGIPTVDGGLGFLTSGDGLVTQDSATLPGIPLKKLWLRGHAVLPFSKSVMREMADFFTRT